MRVYASAATRYRRNTRNRGTRCAARGGLVKGTQERAQTPEELEAARLEAEAASEQERLNKVQAAKDRVLLDTFSNVEDMELARDGQLDAIAAQIKLNESQIKKLEKDIDERITAAAEVERRGSKPPAQIANAIESLRAQIDRKHAFIEGKHAEQIQVQNKFNADMERFRTLKGISL